jgi:hypothetical protein
MRIVVSGMITADSEKYLDSDWVLGQLPEQIGIKP